MKTSAIILAAGLSSRMGDFKPLMKLKEKTVVENLIDSIIEAEIDEIIIVLGFRGKDVERHIKSNYKFHLTLNKITFVYNEEYKETDMLTSIKIGIKSLSYCHGFYIIPGDMPAIKKDTFISLKNSMIKSKSEVVFATLNGYKKHPPLISYRFKDTILDYEGEGGLREIWKLYNINIKYVPVNDYGCAIDIDTKRDYEALVKYINNRDNLIVDKIG